MGGRSEENTVIKACMKYMYVDKDLDAFVEFLESTELSINNNLYERSYNWILNTINYIEATEKLTQDQFVYIEKFKLEILTKFIEKYSFYASLIGELEDESLDTVIMHNEFGQIYKRYLPSMDNYFSLPQEGGTLLLTIRGAKNDNNKKFDAQVEVDYRGMVTNITKEPSPSLLNSEPQDFSDIYTSLFQDAMKHDINADDKN